MPSHTLPERIVKALEELGPVNDDQRAKLRELLTQTQEMIVELADQNQYLGRFALDVITNQERPGALAIQHGLLVKSRVCRGHQLSPYMKRLAKALDKGSTPGAVISDDQKYRYLLHRDIQPLASERKAMVFVMLNPSTADATEDDPTIRRCIGFAKREDATDLYVLNLYAYRATDPEELKQAPDPVGPENDRWLMQFLDAHDQVVCAVGGERKPRQSHDIPGRCPPRPLHYALPGRAHKGRPPQAPALPEEGRGAAGL